MKTVFSLQSQLDSAASGGFQNHRFFVFFQVWFLGAHLRQLFSRFSDFLGFLDVHSGSFWSQLLHQIACSKIAGKKVQNMERGRRGRRGPGGLCPLKREKDRVPRFPDLTSRGSNTPSVPKGTVADNIYIYI